jgi:MFS family permease
VLSQTLAATWAPRRQLRAGTAAMVAGPLLLVTSVWLPTPSLALFLIGGSVSGIATGLLFKGALGTVAAVAPADRRAEALAGIFLAGYLGLTVPVVGLGFLTQVAAADVSLTLFAALLISGAVVAARPVLRAQAPEATAPEKPEKPELATA